MLSDEQIKKFQSIYKKRFGKEISYQDALESGISLVRMMQIIYKPITQAEYDQLQKRKKSYQNCKNVNKMCPKSTLKGATQ